MGWNDLEPDTQIEILKKVPLKTLISLMSVSKSMFSMITNPIFMTSINSRKTLHHIYLYNRTPQGDYKFLVWKDSEQEPMKEGKIVNCPLNYSYSLIGSCDGLLCFNNSFHPDTDQKLVFWNPYLGRFLTFPIRPMSDQRSDAFRFGFGFDRSRLDYKFVRFGIQPGTDECNVRVDIFVLFEGKWKEAVGSISRHASRIMGRGVYINGVVHWVLELKENCDSKYSILTFNLAKEMFGEIDLAEGIGHGSMTLTTLTVSGEEKLAAYHNAHICNVWVMEEYGLLESWRKLCAIDVGNEFGIVLNAWENGEIIMSTNQGRLLSYNPRSQKQIDIPLGQKAPLIDCVGPYVESLVFPDQYHGTMCGKTL